MGSKGYTGMLRDAPPRAGLHRALVLCGAASPRSPAVGSPPLGSVLPWKERAEPGPILPCPGEDVFFSGPRSSELCSSISKMQ